MTNQISAFSTPDINDLPEDIRDLILTVQKKSGFVPNVFLALARRPDEFRAFIAYHDALMERDSGLTKAEREMIVVATSSLNQCQYCVVAHGAILRIRAKNALIADQIVANYRKADITERQRAMLDFAVKVAQSANEVGEADFELLYAQGFSDDDIWDIMVAMNTVDVLMTGGAKLTWWVIPFMLFAGYITPLPYNYWRLKALGKGCCH